MGIKVTDLAGQSTTAFWDRTQHQNGQSKGQFLCCNFIKYLCGCIYQDNSIYFKIICHFLDHLLRGQELPRSLL